MTDEQPTPPPLDLAVITERIQVAMALGQDVGSTALAFSVRDTVLLIGEVARLRADLAAARAEVEEYQQSFDLWHRAEQRGLADWRAGHPDRELRLPDTGYWTQWLIEDRERLRAALGDQS